MPDDSSQDQDESRRPERPEREAEAPEKKGGLPLLGNQTTVAEPLLPDMEMSGEVASSPPACPDSLLGDRGINGRGNASVRVAIVQRMQQTYGNRATQRMLQRMKSGSEGHDDDVAGRIQQKAGSGTTLE